MPDEGYTARPHKWPKPTDEPPTMDEIQDMVMDVDLPWATDGCGPVEPDGWCEHGHPSWIMWYGLI